MGNMRWIEVAGLPGVGKTTLIRAALADRCLAGYTIVESKNPSLLHRLIAKMLLWTWLERAVVDKSFARSLAYRISFRIPVMCRKVFYFDSGIIQLLLEKVIECNGNIPEDAMRAFLKIPLPRKLLYVTDEIDSVIGRELGRKNRRFQDMSAETLRERYIQAENIIKERIFPLIPEVYAINVNDPEAFKKAIKE